MSTLITVREYARLTINAVEPSLDRAQVSATAFDWLCKQSESFSKAGAALVQVEGRHWLRLDSYVGVLETPCGTRLEILPKHFEDGDCEVQSRALLRRMIQRSLNLKPREVGPAALELYNAPLSEWVMGQFLAAFDHLSKRGMRFDYQRIEEEQRYLRGQLNVVAQMRQPPARQQFFQVRHDIFVADRAENRLLKLALERVCKATQEPTNWRLAHELRSLLNEVPASSLVREDFRVWGTDRLMAHYQPIKPWCELILNQQMPIAVAGDWQGISLLFPMEKLFERYFEAWLRRSLPPEAKLTSQASSEYLCEHNHGRMFRLEPDLLVRQGSQCWVLDTKWKRLNAADRDKKYGLNQSDFYQLFAYGHKYRLQQSAPTLVLIYPYWSGLKENLPVFDYGDDLKLWVLPFDLDNGLLLNAEKPGLPVQPVNEQRQQVRF